MKLESLRDLFANELADIYNAEEQLVKALPKMAEAAQNSELKAAINDHLAETKQQVERLEGIISRLSPKPRSKTCKAMKGLIEEGNEMAKQSGDPATIDAGIIAAAQRVEHYEIAAYGCARTYAELLGDQSAAEALETSLQEEKNADQTLNDLALQVVNLEAARA